MTEPEPRAISRLDWLLIGVLIALVLPLRLWLISNTEVTARDSIGYIRYALQFERYGWKQTLLSNHQHPGYPALVWLTSLPVRFIDGDTTPDNMELSAQLVNLAASLLLILPMYFLGRQFFERTVCFWAVILHQYLPISGQHLSDGISEPIYLVLLSSGLLQAVHAVRDHSVWRCQLCGLFTGLAYLTRPEGALILPSLLIALFVAQIVPAWRSTRLRYLECSLAAATTAMVVGSIYVFATGQITNKPAANVIIGVNGAVDARQSSSTVGGPLFAARVAQSDHRSIHAIYSLGAIAAEINQGLHYGGAIPALLGLWWSFGSMRRQIVFWVLVVYAVIHGGILVALGLKAAYISDRHVMILVLFGCYFTVAGLRELPGRVLAWFKANDGIAWYRSAPLWSAVLFLTLIGACLPKTTQRLHGNRVANHEAGLWLADHLEVGDHVEDDHSWSHFFAGLVFQEDSRPILPADLVPKCYIVTTRSRDPMIDEQRQTRGIAKEAKVVYVWPPQAETDKARVVIYAQPRNPVTQPWRKRSN